MKTTRYSGTPLDRKLGIKEGFTIRLINPPPYYFELFPTFPKAVVENEDPAVFKDFIHCFFTDLKTMEDTLPGLIDEIKPNGMIWVSWPKQSSGVNTDIKENTIREMALAHQLVDVKVCAVDPVWSGLKLVIRKEFRPQKK